MNIELGWTDERAVYILAGIELVAFRVPGQKWKVKTGRCNMCGKCCMNLRIGHLFPIIDGRCIHLEKEPGKNPSYRCQLGLHRPFGCCIGIPEKLAECTEAYEEMDESQMLQVLKRVLARR